MRKLLLLCLCAILLGTAAPALANSPSQGAYGGTGNNQLSKVQSNTSDTTASSSTLPFTGLNVPVVAAIAAGLVGAGVVLRIRTRTDS
jgi:hypothetical protein